jgi:hypothetical protein
MAQLPKATDLFGDVKPKKAAELQEQYLGELNKSFSNPSTVPGQAPTVDAASQIEALVANKSLSPDAVGSLNAALAAQRIASADIVKDISLTSPLSTSFAAFDLEAPAKLLTPRPTPLRNKIVRKKGVGTSHRVKRITGYTGTGTGGQGNIWPGITETTTTAFGSINFERGPKIAYTADDLVIPYNSYSLSDSVSFDANFSGLGYQDLRQLSSTSTLYATMLMEERMFLYSRGTASGFSGALAAPTVTLSAVSATGSQVGLTNGTTYYVYATSSAGSFGESVLSTVQSQAITTGQVVKIVVNNVVGAVGTKVYVGTTTGAANAHYVGTVSSLTGFINGTGGPVTGDNLVFNTTGTLASTITADTSAYATGYDGIIPTVLGANSGSVNEINAAFSTSNPGVEYQTVFGSLYDGVKADPDEILINGADRRQLSDAIKNGSTANYRLNLSQTDTGDYVGGAVIGALHNETTGKLVDITVHPWLQPGVSPVLSYTLPIPDTEVSDVWAAVNVQDYMGIQWPVTQFAYEFSTYYRGTFFCYAPAWNGAVSGIVSA